MIKKLLIKLFNKLKLHNKFLIMYVFCVIIPLFITDAVIVRAIYDREYNSKVYQLENIANLYISSMKNTFEYSARMARAFSGNHELYRFLDAEYETPYLYFEEYYQFINNSFFKSIMQTRTDKITIYVDNPTISYGSYFKSMQEAKSSEWYRRYEEMGSNASLLVYFDDTVDPRLEKQQKIIYVQKMNKYSSSYEKIIKIEIDNTILRNQLIDISDEFPMFVCNDDYVVFARYGEGVKSINPQKLQKDYKIGVHQEFSYLGTTLDVYLFSDNLSVYAIFLENYWIIVIMIIVTLMLPVIIMNLIEQSLASRIKKFEKAFSGKKENKFLPIEGIDGDDEISQLMLNYNNIVSINNDLINTLYKDKLKEQANALSRKNAELLALQSQINPHFLFNSLESIRMHSILKGEEQTAEMVEKLAVMTRQNVEWGNDLVTIKKEAESIEAYLYLQSYRFGDRLSFDIDVEPDCEMYLIPKLTLVTFVENACVHGIESKSSAGWIFVRVYKKENDIFMEIEDTGGGMSDEEVSDLSENINNVSIDMIKGKKNVGILNACLRIKMHTDNQVKFFIESEVGVGVSVTIRVPANKLKRQS